MSPKIAIRKLSAILSADAKDYSRLMRSDEVATVRTLTRYRTIIAELISKYQGRVVDSPGDNILAEFASVVHAVQCGFEIQDSLKTENAELSEDRRMEFRIGINLGDVIQEGERIYGDGVNVAARMESLAEAGGICVSGSAYDQIEYKFAFGCEYLGEQTVKNISTPIRVYRLSSDDDGKECIIYSQVQKSSHRLLYAVILGLLILSVGGFRTWTLYRKQASTSLEAASVDKMALPLPGKPSIAVLPFANMSNDKQQEYFSDGITEDIITDLSANSRLFVIARNSTFTYKAKSLKIQRVAEELGVRYILEGSVRKAGNQVRINAQLLDATTGHYLWAKRYDGRLTDVFALQDEITEKIVSALNIRLSVAEQEEANLNETDNINAYDAFLKGWGYYRRNTRNDWAKAISHLEEAVRFDPEYTRAYALMSMIYWRYSRTSRPFFPNKELGINYAEARARAREYLQLAMRKPTSVAYRVAASMALYRRQYRKAHELAERAIELDPNDVDGIYTMSYILLASGNRQKGVDIINKGMRLDPHNIAEPLYLLGIAHFSNGQLVGAVSSIERALLHNPKLPRPVPILPAALALLGRMQEARLALDTLKQSGTIGYSFQNVMFNFPFNDAQTLDLFVKGIRKAGLWAPDYKFIKFSQEDMLGEEQIRKLLFGRKITGSYLSDVGVYEFLVERTESGKAIWTNLKNSLGYNDTGRSWVEDDMLCDQWAMHFNGMKYCMAVFQNHNGDLGNKNEYVAVSDSNFIQFSAID